MDVTTLICFVKIAEGETFQSVADEYHLSQSNLSKMIKRLENELNTNLFIRAHRTVTLTEAGQCLYTGLKKISPQFYETLNEMASFSNQCTISCCVVPAPTVCDLTEHFRLFSNEHPDIYLNIRKEENTFRALERLNSIYDCAIMHYPFFRSDSIHYTWLYDDPLFLVLPKNHPFAQRGTVSISEIAGESILCRSYIYDAIVNSGNICTSQASPLTVINSRNFRRSRMLSQIAYGHSIALFFKSDISAFNLSNISICHLEEIPSIPIAFLQRADPNISAKTQVLRDYLTNCLRRLS